MAPTTDRRGGRYATTYDYVAANLGIHKPYIPAENRIVKALIEAALESGLQSPDAVRLALGVYKEIDVLARDEHGNILSRTALKDIRAYCRAILRSGVTFDSREIAAEAVATWRATAEELKKLHEEWDRESVTRRLKARKGRQEQATQARILRSEPVPDDAEELYDDGAFDELQELDEVTDDHR